VSIGSRFNSNCDFILELGKIGLKLRGGEEGEGFFCGENMINVNVRNGNEEWKKGMEWNIDMNDGAGTAVLEFLWIQAFIVLSIKLNLL
jgi:hypothetical protein